jgi:hypothetical protein
MWYPASSRLAFTDACACATQFSARMRNGASIWRLRSTGRRAGDRRTQMMEFVLLGIAAALGGYFALRWKPLRVSRDQLPRLQKIWERRGVPKLIRLNHESE